MAFVLFMGAAFTDAFEWQRKAIREYVGVHLEHMKSSDRAKSKEGMIEALKFVQEIMGPNWTPNEEYSRQIEKFLEGE